MTKIEKIVILLIGVFCLFSQVLYFFPDLITQPYLNKCIIETHKVTAPLLFYIIVIAFIFEFLINNDKIDLKIEEEFEWSDDNVIDFVNWYIELHDLDFRYSLENKTILESFKNGDDVNLWKNNLKDK